MISLLYYQTFKLLKLLALLNQDIWMPYLLSFKEIFLVKISH